MSHFSSATRRTIRVPFTAIEHLANSVRTVAIEWRLMLEKEKEDRPLKIAAVSVVGILVAAVLALFVVLEIQWIRLWSHRRKNEKQTIATKQNG